MTNNIDRVGEYVLHPTVHDKYCPVGISGEFIFNNCECMLIRQVRADERAVLRHEKTPPHPIIPG